MQHPQWLPWTPFATQMHVEVHKDSTTSSVPGTTLPGLPTPLGQRGTDFTTIEAVLVSPAMSRTHGSQLAHGPPGYTGLRSGAGPSSYQPKDRRQILSLLWQKALVRTGDICQSLAGCHFAAPATCFLTSPEHLSPEYFQRAQQVLPPPWSLPWFASSNCSLPGHTRTEFPSSSLVCAPACTWPYC